MRHVYIIKTLNPYRKIMIGDRPCVLKSHLLPVDFALAVLTLGEQGLPLVEVPALQ